MSETKSEMAIGVEGLHATARELIERHEDAAHKAVASLSARLSEIEEWRAHDNDKDPQLELAIARMRKDAERAIAALLRSREEQIVYQSTFSEVLVQLVELRVKAWASLANFSEKLIVLAVGVLSLSVAAFGVLVRNAHGAGSQIRASVAAVAAVCLLLAAVTVAVIDYYMLSIAAPCFGIDPLGQGELWR